MSGISLTEYTCPICDKQFVPAPLHVYKVRYKVTCGEPVLVCSWRCLREGEKMMERDRKRKSNTTPYARRKKA